MNDHSLEFQDINDDSTRPGIVRKSFRVPVESTQDMWVEIDSEKYSIVDIGEEGISIALTASSQFQLDQKLNNCSLHLDGEVIQNLSGLIVHLSSDPDNGWQYGIQWIDMETASMKRLSEIFKKLKSILLNGE